MRLSLPLVKKDGPRPNRKVRKRTEESAETSGSRTGKNGRTTKSPKARDRIQGGKARAVLRRMGAAVWPERFPDVVAKREERKDSRRTSSKGFIWIWTFAVALAAAAFIGHLHVRFDIIQAGYSLSRAQAEQRQQRLTQRELRLELATLKEPGRIEAQARTDLGMERPGHERIVRLDGRRRSRRSSRGGNSR